MIDFERELLKTGEEFRARLYKTNPARRDFKIIDATLSVLRSIVIARLENAAELSGEEQTEFLGLLAKQYFFSPEQKPDLVDRAWQLAWKVWGDSIGHQFDAPVCDRTDDELLALKRQKRGAILVPDEIYTSEGLILLGRIFPGMRSWAVDQGTSMTNEYGNGGCMDVEMEVNSPNLGTTEDSLRQLFISKERLGQRGATYIVASQFYKLGNGLFFDETNTRSRLLGSRVRDRVPDVTFTPGGHFQVGFSLDRFRSLANTGGRSERFKANL